MRNLRLLFETKQTTHIYLFSCHLISRIEARLGPYFSPLFNFLLLELFIELFIVVEGIFTYAELCQHVIRCVSFALAARFIGRFQRPSVAVYSIRKALHYWYLQSHKGEGEREQQPNKNAVKVIDVIKIIIKWKNLISPNNSNDRSSTVVCGILCLVRRSAGRSVHLAPPQFVYSKVLKVRNTWLRPSLCSITSVIAMGVW